MIDVTGLTAQEAALRLVQYGPNVLQAAKTRTFAVILLGTLREPMFLFLIAAAGLYLAVGDLGEGLFLLGGALRLPNPPITTKSWRSACARAPAPRRRERDERQRM